MCSFDARYLYQRAHLPVVSPHYLYWIGWATKYHMTRFMQIPTQITILIRRRDALSKLTYLQCLSPVLFRHNHHRQPTPLYFVVSCKRFGSYFPLLLSPLCRTYYLDHSSEPAVSQEDVLNRLQIRIFMMISSKWRSCCLPLSPDSHSEEWQVCWGPLCRLSLASGWRSSTERTLTFIAHEKKQEKDLCRIKKWESGKKPLNKDIPCFVNAAALLHLHD